MVDPALVYVGGVTLLFFFWIYGIVAFVRDVKNKVIPAYRQYRRDDEDHAGGEADVPDTDEGPRVEEERDELDEQRLREIYGS